MHPPLRDHLVMGALVAGARLAALRLSVAQVARGADRLGELLWVLGPAHGAALRAEEGAGVAEMGERSGPGRAALQGVEAAADEARVLAHRVSRIIPGANCLHRAAAARVWLAAHGLDARIAIGLRKREALEGHAWLEIETADGLLTLFAAEADGYRGLWTPEPR